jgi:hypothetical protein
MGCKDNIILLKANSYQEINECLHSFPIKGGEPGQNGPNAAFSASASHYRSGPEIPGDS